MLNGGQNQLSCLLAELSNTISNFFGTGSSEEGEGTADEVTISHPRHTLIVLYLMVP